MKIIAHVGFHKTGTTSFQDLIRTNLSRLPSYVVVEVRGRPLADKLRMELHDFHMNPSSIGLQKVRTSFDDILNNATNKNAEIVFISLESSCGLARIMAPQSLYSTGRQVLQLYAEASLGHELKLLFSTRNVKDWVRSLHGHIAKHGNSGMSFGAFASADPIQNFDWTMLITRLSAGLDARIATTSLEETKDTRLGALSDFLYEFLNEEQLQSWVPVPKSNEGLPPALVRFLLSPPISALPTGTRKRLIKLLHATYRKRKFFSFGR